MARYLNVSGSRAHAKPLCANRCGRLAKVDSAGRGYCPGCYTRIRERLVRRIT